MAYHHTRKAGNPADVWKHFALLTVLSDLVDESGTESAPFSYLDTHCGEGLYDLGAGGEWIDGVGRLQPLPERLSGHPYLESLAGILKAEPVYRGSWLLVADYLGRRGRRASLSLYDTDPGVGRRLEAVLSDRPGIRFQCGDGFPAVASDRCPELVLVDPPYSPDPAMDFRRAAIASGTLALRRTPFLIWYPLAGGSGGPLPGTGVAYELVWGRAGDRRSQAMPGCGMLAGGRAAQLLAAHTEELSLLAEHVGAAFRIQAAS